MIEENNVEETTMLSKIEEKKGFKKTKLGWIPDDWQIVKLGDFIDFKNGVNAGKDDFEFGVKFVNVMDVFSNSHLTNEKISGVVNLDDNSIETNKLLYGDILFNRTSETREDIARVSVYLDHETSVFGGFVIRGRFLKELLTHKYKKYVFLSPQTRRQVIVKGQGVIRTNIGQKDLEKVLLSFPEKKEQKAIASCLNTWDNAIENLSKLIAQKELQKKGLMQQLLTGKKRLEGFGGEILFKKLKPFVKEFSERNSKVEVTSVLSVTNKRGFINQSEQFDRVVASKDLSNYKIVRKGQFAYNPSRINVGSLDLLTNFEVGLLSPMYVIFETKKEKLVSDFLYYQLNTWWFKGHISQFVQGSVRDSLAFEGLSNMTFFIPSLEEQKTIVDILKCSDKEINNLSKKLKQLKKQKKGLMQQLLTGNKRLKHE